MMGLEGEGVADVEEHDVAVDAIEHDGSDGDDSSETIVFEDSDFDLNEDLQDEDDDANKWKVEVRKGENRSQNRANDDEYDESDNSWAMDEGAQSDGFDSIHSSDEEETSKKWPYFITERDMRNPKFKAGMLFASIGVLKKAVKQYAIINKVYVKIVRNNKDRVNAKCKNCDGWMLNASLNQKCRAIQIKKFKDNHSCSLELPDRYVTYKWLSETYMDQIRADPNWSSKSFAHQLEVDYKAKSGRTKLWRAKRHALESLRGSKEKQYNKLWDYAGELQRTNPGTTVFIGCDHLIFQNMYVCLDACKRGFLAGCRPLIGLDGCFLKGMYKGQLLIAVGIDGNDCIFPIAYAVVDVEGRESWTWFLRNLQNDLNIGDSSCWTFMADNEKDLVHALHEIMPHAEKRFCLRHLWKNMCRADTIKKGKELKDLLWAAAKATYLVEYDRRMEMLKKEDIKAWEWLFDKPPHQWSKAHFKEHSKCDILLNNHSESFNRCILEARDQPILTMLEMIRCKLMKRMCMKRKVAEKYTGQICPKILKKLERMKLWASNCWPTEAGERKYSVSQGDKIHVVDLEKMTCSCRRWQLSGIPCHHSISCILKRRRNPEFFIDDCYSLATLKDAYSYVINPLRDIDDYDQTGRPPVKPPLMKIKKGRQSKVGRKTIDEVVAAQDGVEVLSNKGSIVSTCGTCGGNGHNKRTCHKRSNSSNVATEKRCVEVSS